MSPICLAVLLPRDGFVSAPRDLFAVATAFAFAFGFGDGFAVDVGRGFGLALTILGFFGLIAIYLPFLVVRGIAGTAGTFGML
jgi:hypothetical protein